MERGERKEERGGSGQKQGENEEEGRVVLTLLFP